MKFRTLPLAVPVLLAMTMAVAAPPTVAAIDFHPAKQYVAGVDPYAVAIGDLNGDGFAELVVANQGTPQGSGGSISILINNGDGTFRRGLNFDRGGIFLSIVLGDFDGDGNLDIAAVNAKTNSVDVLLGNGNGSFGPVVSYAANANEAAKSIAVGELSPGILSLVVAQSCTDVPCQASDLGVLVGNGDGSFQNMVSYSTNAKNIHSPVIADVNKDGSLDVVAGTDSGIVTFGGRGDGTFAAGLYQNAQLGTLSLATGEFNGDGSIDLAVVNRAKFVTVLGVLLGNGSGKFFGGPVGTIHHPGVVAAADLDVDGHDDLVVKGASDNNVYVVPGNGNGTFQQAQAYNVHSTLGTVSIGDLNNDGFPDIVAADGKRYVQVLINVGK